MTHIGDAQLQDFQSSLIDSFEQCRQHLVDIIEHSSTPLLATKLQKISSDELLDLASTTELLSNTPDISKIKNIDAALTNIEIGIYGICADCEEDIEIAQLKLNPTQQRCPLCDAKYKKQKYNNYKL